MTTFVQVGNFSVSVDHISSIQLNEDGSATVHTPSNAVSTDDPEEISILRDLVLGKLTGQSGITPPADFVHIGNFAASVAHISSVQFNKDHSVTVHSLNNAITTSDPDEIGALTELVGRDVPAPAAAANAPGPLLPTPHQENQPA